MKELLQSLAISFSMYSKLPVPQVTWNEKNSRYVILFFPLIGVLIGALMAALYWGAALLSFPRAVTALLLMALPVLLTGGIHLDGFLDTSDARSSYRDREKRLQILKDPHVGAFGVIRVILFFVLLMAGLLLALSRWKGSVLFLIPMFAFSRTLSGLSVVFFPCANKEGTLYYFSGEGVKKRVRLIMLLEVFSAGAFMILLSPLAGALSAAGGVLVFWYYYGMSKREFGGITGDLAGWFLCMAELFFVWMIALSTYLREMFP